MTDKKEINGKLKTANPVKGLLFTFGIGLAIVASQFLFYLIPIIGWIWFGVNMLALIILPLLVFFIPYFRKYYTGKCPACERKIWYLKMAGGGNCPTCKSRVFFVEDKGFEAIKGAATDIYRNPFKF